MTIIIICDPIRMPVAPAAGSVQLAEPPLAEPNLPRVSPMFVCVCRAVSDRKIRQAVAAGACSVRELKDGLGLGSVCGRCVPEARQLIAECRNQQAARRLDELPAAAAA